jgi:hypothetical protein
MAEHVEPEYYATSTLAKILVVAPQTILKVLRKAGITEVRVGVGRNASLRWPKTEVDAWLASRRIERKV